MYRKASLQKKNQKSILTGFIKNKFTIVMFLILAYNIDISRDIKNNSCYEAGKKSLYLAVTNQIKNRYI